jgi:hypothetical protein
LNTSENEMVQRLIEEALKPLREQVEKFESTDFAGYDHYHDEYASVDHVKRSENSFNSQLYQIKNDISNLEYRSSDVQRAAERAQSAADSAARTTRGYY